MKQLLLFDETIIPRICDAMNLYISAQPRQGIWIPGAGWHQIPDAAEQQKPTQLSMNAKDIELLKRFFELDPDVKELNFWNCDVIETKTFLPFFS